MVRIIEYGKYKSSGEYDNKSQIILTHTSRYVNDYLQSLKYRHNGGYNKIPNYVISRDGKILQLLKNNESSCFFKNPEIDNKSIIISLENLGWIQKEPLTDHYVNWIGDIYKGEVFERKWRDYYFWQPYTDVQIESLVELTKQLFEETSIKFQIIGHNTKITDFHKYEGLLTRSNYDVEFTDVSPAFNFENFIKKIENE
jgi:N-acetyl-anhydromuramyl-L-alanine amidase AmpD